MTHFKTGTRELRNGIRIAYNNQKVLVLLPVACLVATLGEKENDPVFIPPVSKKIAHEEGYM